MNQPVHQYGLPSNITSSRLIYTGPGTVQAFVVNSNSSGSIKLWDALTATGTVIFNTYTFSAGSSSVNLYGAKFNTGLYATITGTADVTVVYNPYVGG